MEVPSHGAHPRSLRHKAIGAKFYYGIGIEGYLIRPRFRPEETAITRLLASNFMKMFFR